MGMDATDRIMSNEKTPIRTDREEPLLPKLDDDGNPVGETKPTKPAKVVALTIDENDDFGGDPYNHTGSFCVPEFDD